MVVLREGTGGPRGYPGPSYFEDRGWIWRIRGWMAASGWKQEVKKSGCLRNGRALGGHEQTSAPWRIKPAKRYDTWRFVSKARVFRRASIMKVGAGIRVGSAESCGKSRQTQSLV